MTLNCKDTIFDYAPQRSPIRGGLRGLFLALILPLAFVACSEDENIVDEYENWQERNDTYFATLADSLARGRSAWTRLKNFSLDQATEGQQTDYVYMKKLVGGTGDESPRYTDSVRVAYQGRLIPTVSHPQGYVFDTTIYGDFDLKTAATAKFLTSGLVDGFATAVMHMHQGERCRIYIPYKLGYNATEKTGVPAYSTLIFDIALIDFSPAGQDMPSWKAPRH